MAQCEIIVLSKYPTPGKVKTRLMPKLSAEQACEVHRICLLHLLPRLSAIGRTAVAFDPPDAGGRFAELIAGQGAARLFAQSAGDLGARLIAAYEDSVGNGSSAVVFFGTDSPDVPHEAVCQIVSAISSGEYDVAIGPTEDGGYWTIAIAAGVDVARLLADIPWSSGREYAATVASGRGMGLRIFEGARWPDVDRFEDLAELVRRVGGSPLGKEMRNVANVFDG